MTLRIDPYSPASKAAKELSKYTGILRATNKQVQKHGTFDTVLNWGNSERRFHDARYINDPEAVAIASDKLRSAEKLREAGVRTPAFTTDRVEAEEWVGEGRTVVCRTLLRACAARGIRLVTAEREGTGESESSDEADLLLGLPGLPGRGTGRGTGLPRRGRTLVDAPLYTLYVKKADEYRVHVFDGEVIDVQQKRKRQEIPNEDVDYQIRNLDSGWVFCRDGVDAPAAALDMSISAVAALGLDFGAVDVGYNRHDDAVYIFEVNTAPGLEGSTLEAYYNALSRRLPALERGAYKRRRG